MEVVRKGGVSRVSGGSSLKGGELCVLNIDEKAKWNNVPLGLFSEVNPICKNNDTKANLGAIDGLDAWEALSQNTASNRTEVLHNIDDIIGNAALTVGDWKIVVGPGWDKWRVVNCCKEIWCLLTAVQSRCTQQEPITTLEFRETECIDHLKRAGKGALSLQHVAGWYEKAVQCEGRVSWCAGSSYNGDWDGWYGPSGREEGSYDVDKVLASPAARSLAAAGCTLTADIIRELRAEAQVQCSPQDRAFSPANTTVATTNCKPLQAPCLFHMRSDPCEKRNLADWYYTHTHTHTHCAVAAFNIEVCTAVCTHCTSQRVDTGLQGRKKREDTEKTRRITISENSAGNQARFNLVGACSLTTTPPRSPGKEIVLGETNGIVFLKMHVLRPKGWHTLQPPELRFYTRIKKMSPLSTLLNAWCGNDSISVGIMSRGIVYHVLMIRVHSSPSFRVGGRKWTSFARKQASSRQKIYQPIASMLLAHAQKGSGFLRVRRENGRGEAATAIAGAAAVRNLYTRSAHSIMLAAQAQATSPSFILISAVDEVQSASSTLRPGTHDKLHGPGPARPVLMIHGEALGSTHGHGTRLKQDRPGARGWVSGVFRCRVFLALGMVYTCGHRPWRCICLLTTADIIATLWTRPCLWSCSQYLRLLQARLRDYIYTLYTSSRSWLLVTSNLPVSQSFPRRKTSIWTAGSCQGIVLCRSDAKPAKSWPTTGIHSTIAGTELTPLTSHTLPTAGPGEVNANDPKHDPYDYNSNGPSMYHFAATRRPTDG
ncbi:hypothetical protein PR048_005186 [Dryococelus australis]|uniref:ShKT domain-containing protein n=1 Tax=Dryococelus australis TaxID=614101 RepID=A0ABQ9I7G1_9NEOP|nr:hypothetical protein PR048_005186 [Dryococelus australis]